LWLLPSEPVSDTAVAFIAVTVKVDDPPSVIEVGLATIVTEGDDEFVTVTTTVAEAFPPEPVAFAV
jgi:hypothetical protein